MIWLGVTPNWRWDMTDLPIDTLRPPPSYPVEWGYLQSTTSDNWFTIDAYSEDLNPTELQARVKDIAPDIVIVSTTPSYLFWRCPPVTLGAVTEATHRISEVVDTHIIAVGPHGVVSPDEVLDSCKSLDAVWRGELSQNFFEALRTGASPRHSLREKSGKRPSSVAPQEPIGPWRPPIGWRASAVHSWLPSMSAELRDMPGALFESSRGCVFDCPFCFREGFRRDLRLKPHENIRSELSCLAGLGIRYVYLIDENFGTPKRHAFYVAKELARLGFSWGMQTRPDIWSAKEAGLLAELGCIYVEVGLETLNAGAHDRLGKFAKFDQALQGVASLKDSIRYVGINSFDTDNPDIMSGGRPPGVDELGLPVGTFIPYPGTPWGERCFQRLGLPAGLFRSSRAALRVYREFERPSDFGVQLRADPGMRAYWAQQYFESDADSLIGGLSRRERVDGM